MQPGTRIGSYEVIAPIGAGGMGEVCRARDTTLKRDVALKMLPGLVATDAERLARFTREAQTLAALNHPNIAQIYGVVDSEPGPSGSPGRVLVMEYVEGEDLSERLTRGPLPLDETLAIAKQIAEALETAHDLGIVHRDLKPGNIRLRPDGTVKVLDFGLARSAEPAAAAGPLQTGAGVPTVTSPAVMTHAGMVLGTAAYMAPEQAKGRPVDKRADIWAFGCVLFEMLTGRRVFDGESVTETLAAVMRDTPPLEAVPPGTPPAIRRLLARCLERDPRLRLRDIGEARITLDRPMASGSEPEPARDQKTRPRFPLLWWVITAVAVAVAATAAAVAVTGRDSGRVLAPAPLRLSADLGTEAALVTAFGAAAVLSPDGRVLSFVGRGSDGTVQLYVRQLNGLAAVPLAGTTDARDPFFSPDGAWLAFFADGKLKKVPTAGGVVVTLAEVRNSRGGTWADDGTIVFQPFSAQAAGVGHLMRVSASGGTPEALTTLERGEATQRWPQVLPGSRAVVFTSHTTTVQGYENASIVVQTIPGGERKTLVQGGYYARYASSGHLLYIHNGSLFAAPFDLSRLALAGPAVPVLEDVSTTPGFGGAQFSVAGTGCLVYVRGATVAQEAPLAWITPSGATTSVRDGVLDWSAVRVSPDGRSLALTLRGADRTNDIWVQDLSRATLSRITFEPEDDNTPEWTPDGTRLSYYAGMNSPWILWRRADGGGAAQRLVKTAGTPGGMSWHPSGRMLAYIDGEKDLKILPLSGDESSGWMPGKPSEFLATPYHHFSPAFSPDGRWLAYSSNETGRYEIYVRPFPGPGGKWQISTTGGRGAVWSRSAPVLLFETPNQGGSEPQGTRIMAAPYSVAGASFRADTARPWSPMAVIDRPSIRSVDLHPDGQRVVGAPLVPNATPRQDRLVFVLDFGDELRGIKPR